MNRRSLIAGVTAGIAAVFRPRTTPESRPARALIRDLQPAELPVTTSEARTAEIARLDLAISETLRKIEASEKVAFAQLAELKKYAATQEAIIHAFRDGIQKRRGRA